MSMFNKVTKTFQWGQNTVIMETGEIARQSGGAVMVNIEGTVVLATVVASKNAKPGQDFFPLTVDYLEKTYAAGKIPGGFIKREGRPHDHEILACRIIDRSQRKRSGGYVLGYPQLEFLDRPLRHSCTIENKCRRPLTLAFPHVKSAALFSASGSNQHSRKFHGQMAKAATPRRSRQFMA